MGFLVDGEARVAFTNEPGAVPQPPDNGEVKVQQADALLITRKADGTPRFTDLRPMEEQLEVGPLANALANAVPATHTSVSDANYQCLSSDAQVGMITLTAPRVISLPDVDTFPFRDLVIADESGACSDTLTITIQPGAGTGDTIAGATSIVLSSPYQGLRFRRGAANLWIRL
jgi:hypothetical protein